MHDNKVYKILRIVFLTLAILSLVFTLAKKVGLCASDSSSSGVKNLPFRVGAGYGNTFTSEQISRIYEICYEDMIGAQDSGYTQIDYICIIDNYGSDFAVYCFQNNSGNGFSRPSGSSVTFPLSGEFRFRWSSPSGYSGCRRVSISKSSFTRTDSRWVSSSSVTLDASTLTELSPDGSYVQKQNSYVTGMPLYISSDLSYDGVTYFSNSSHSQGGSLVDPDLDWGAIDQILNTTQLISDTVDNTWTNFTFWQKLLNILVQGFNNFVHTGQWLLNNLLSFFKPVFDSILNVLQWLVSFFNTLFSALTTFFGSILDFVENGFQSVLTAITTFKNSVLDAFSSITSSISGFFTGLYNNISGFFGHLHEIYEWFYNHGLDSDHEFDFMVLFHYLFDFDSSAALTAFQNNKYGDFILDVRDFGSTLFTSITGATASERVFFTISLGDHFGTHFQDITIDFDWYASIRDTFLPYLMAFVYVSAIWLFIKRLPDIIHGAASAESSFRDELSGQEFAPTSHGIFTRGVSKNQPSLDKSPLSGGGGVHSGSSQFWY